MLALYLPDLARLKQRLFNTFVLAAIFPLFCASKGPVAQLDRAQTF